jgi:hypothetical protein
VLGTSMLHLYPTAALRVLPAIYLGPGIAVWLFGRDGIHVGASGLVYGLFAYVFVAGLIRRDRRAIAASLLVAFMYGTMAWGVLPIRQGVSWETHLAAALIGVALAIVLRHTDTPPRIQYGWENEAEDHIDDPPSADMMLRWIVDATVSRARRHRADSRPQAASDYRARDQAAVRSPAASSFACASRSAVRKPSSTTGW